MPKYTYADLSESERSFMRSVLRQLRENLPTLTNQGKPYSIERIQGQLGYESVEWRVGLKSDTICIALKLYCEPPQHVRVAVGVSYKIDAEPKLWKDFGPGKALSTIVNTTLNLVSHDISLRLAEAELTQARYLWKVAWEHWAQYQDPTVAMKINVIAPDSKALPTADLRELAHKVMDARKMVGLCAAQSLQQYAGEMSEAQFDEAIQNALTLSDRKAQEIWDTTFVG